MAWSRLPYPANGLTSCARESEESTVREVRVKSNFRLWESLVIRLSWEEENTGPNPVSLTPLPAVKGTTFTT